MGVGERGRKGRKKERKKRKIMKMKMVIGVDYNMISKILLFICTNMGVTEL